jgi:outer membrane protein OmpA-like peptidoglycan-associated protein
MTTLLHGVLILGLVSAGCSLRKPRTAAGETTVVLLTDDNGTTGQARVSNPLGTAELTSARQATDVVAARGPSPIRTLDDQAVQQEFGAALSALPLPPIRVLLRFQFDSDELTDESRAALPALVRQVRERPVPEVVVVGHTDTVGANDVNLQLGMRRAETVRRILVDAGVDPAFIEATSHGEANPLVPTRDNTSEPNNRRVEITLR